MLSSVEPCRDDGLLCCMSNLWLWWFISAKTDADEETLKNELALQYRDMQNKTHMTQNTEPLKKKNSNKGLKKFFTK